MATNAICIVNVIRLQKPLPNATDTAAGVAPLAIAAAATTTTAIATNTKASGNHFSAQAVNAIASRTIAPSRIGRVVASLLRARALLEVLMLGITPVAR